MAIAEKYPKVFYEKRKGISSRSAEQIVPILIDIFQPKSVIDIGCGSGSWLRIFQEKGVGDILGIDGEWVPKEIIEIPGSCFVTHDLSFPIEIDRQFDLVICLEVAEHLPESYSETFVETLTKLGPIVLFSAAVPFQYGKHHVNLQWQNYWADIFNKHGYEPRNVVRARLWDNENIKFYYKQNMLVYVNKDFISTNKKLKKLFDSPTSPLISCIHPAWYLQFADPTQISVKWLIRVLPIALYHSIHRVTIKKVENIKNKLVKKPFHIR
jgi:hypothetical protein